MYIGAEARRGSVGMLWSAQDDRRVMLPERQPLAAIADGGLLDDRWVRRQAVAAGGSLRDGELRCPPLAVTKLDRLSGHSAI
jgi:hypothetical protein